MDESCLELIRVCIKQVDAQEKYSKRNHTISVLLIALTMSVVLMLSVVIMYKDYLSYSSEYEMPSISNTAVTGENNNIERSIK